MTLRTPLRATALIEAGTGLACLLIPRLPIALLFGLTPESPVGLILSRFIGIALVSLGMACWWAANDPASRAAAGVVKAILIYDAMAAVLLVYAGVSGLSGIALWPAVIVHSVMTVSCIAGLRSVNSEPEGSVDAPLS